MLPVMVFLTIISCKNVDKENVEETQEISSELAYNSYGEEIMATNILTAAQMEERFEALQPGDTIVVSFKTTVNSVCKNKGCWMILDLPGDEEDVMVKFKDYGFFVPKDIEQKEVIVNGKAYVAEVSVEEQQHIAEDKGQEANELAAITKPKRTLSFLAEGVLIKE